MWHHHGHLQRANSKHHRHQPQPQKRSFRAAPILSTDKEFTSFPFYFRVMEWVSDDMNNAVNDGDGGEDDGRPISLVRYMANRDRGWI
ncbi:hypothetical protein WN943_012853 [Citrus x changshan-huyou]